MRNFTGVSTGTCAHCGTKEYCSPIILTVTEPSGSAAVPRLLSANSPPRCRVGVSMVSTLLGGCSARVAPVTTMIATITASIASTTVSHRFSVRVTSSSGTIPSGTDCQSGLVILSANRASRQKEEEIKGDPADEEQRHCDGGDDERAYRSVPERLCRCIRPDRRGDMLRPTGGGVMRLVSWHRFQPAPVTSPPTRAVSSPVGNRRQRRRCLDRRASWQSTPWHRDCSYGNLSATSAK